MRNSLRSLRLEMQSSQVYFLFKLFLIRRQINETKDNFLLVINKYVSLFSFIRGIGLLFFFYIISGLFKQCTKVHTSPQ